MEPARPPKNEPYSWFDFLRLETELALTFIQSAELYSNRNDSARALNNARKALTEIRERLAAKRSKSGLTDDEIVFLETRCSVIESQLQLAGNSN